jgi:hypothetical protein
MERECDELPSSNRQLNSLVAGSVLMSYAAYTQGINLSGTNQALTISLLGFNLNRISRKEKL